jgi:hypothetical protein
MPLSDAKLTLNQSFCALHTTQTCSNSYLFLRKAQSKILQVDIRVEYSCYGVRKKKIKIKNLSLFLFKKFN